VPDRTATITLEFPLEALGSEPRSPDEFARELRLAAAIHWYARAEVSMEKAAMIAGLNRRDFLLELSAREIDVFHVDLDELETEVTR
jgi:predicted HTH domain antitoxin